jgi:hypothetical protein
MSHDLHAPAHPICVATTNRLHLWKNGVAGVEQVSVTVNFELHQIVSWDQNWEDLS